MAGKRPGRFLAPVALLAVIIAVVLVVRAGSGHDNTSTVTHTAARLPVTRRPLSPRRFYVVKAGDTLSTISVKTGVPVARLESLNPSVYPNALQTGERLRLRP
jgi:spore germination protein YaaH